MRNWQRWRLGNKRALILGASPASFTRLASSIYQRTDPRRREAIMPLILGEAEDTERAIQSLSSDLRAAVETYYLMPGGMHRKAKACGCRREILLHRLALARRRIISALEDQRRPRAASLVEPWLNRQRRAA